MGNDVEVKWQDSDMMTYPCVITDCHRLSPDGSTRSPITCSNDPLVLCYPNHSTTKPVFVENHGWRCAITYPALTYFLPDALTAHQNTGEGIYLAIRDRRNLFGTNGMKEKGEFRRSNESFSTKTILLYHIPNIIPNINERKKFH